MRTAILRTSALLLTSVLVQACTLPLRSSAFTWQLKLEIDPQASDNAAVLKQAMSVVERRLDLADVPDWKVEPAGAKHFFVKLPAGINLTRLKELITSHGRLELVSVVSPTNPAPLETYATKDEATAAAGRPIPAERRVLPYQQTDLPQTLKWIIVESTPIVDGSQLRDAAAVALSVGQRYIISFTLKPDGARALETWTGAHINSYLAVVWNGEAKTVAYITSRISDQGQITGDFTKENAEDIALILNSGALPGPIRIVSEEHIK